MKNVLIIGSGIAGLSCAVHCAEQGMHATIVSPHPSERSQSVMAAGGINAVLDTCQEGDSIACHIEDTLKGGCDIAGVKSVTGLCKDAPGIVSWLERIGTVFLTDQDGVIKKRAFGGQSFKRTCYCGAATGKQIVTSLVMDVRRLESMELVRRRYFMDFHSVLIRDGVCYGAICYDEVKGDFEIIPADYVVMATGGQNGLFGKTTGSVLCDGYAAGRLFLQGAELKNLEFIQYHPTTIETCQKRMLVSEAARGEGGRLYYEKNGKRVYFMEERFGERGNLMPRDVIARCMDETGEDIFLDVSFLGKKKILDRIPEVYELCRKYLGIDVSRQCIPISPSVHFFMGGIAVKNNHETNIKNLYAIGECASIYHGANRLGGNSLLAAIYGGKVASETIKESPLPENPASHHRAFKKELKEARSFLKMHQQSQSPFPVMYIRDLLAETMHESLGIFRDAESLKAGIDSVTYYLSIADKIKYDSSENAYHRYSLESILTLAKAVLICALNREESRGAHVRRDFPDTREEYAAATIAYYDKGIIRTRLDLEDNYED